MLKRFLNILLVVVFFSASSFNVQESPQGEVKWYTIEEVEALMKQEPRKIYIDVYTDWCGWCKVMDKKTFTHQETAQRLNTDFYAVKLDAEGKEDITFRGHTFKFVNQGRNGYHELAAALLQGKLSYPTSVLLDENMNVIQPLAGYLKPEQLNPILEFIGEDIYKDQSWESFVASKK